MLVYTMGMSWIATYRKSLWLAAAALAIATIAVVAFVFLPYRKWKEGRYFGRVVDVGPQSVIIAEGKLGERTIGIAPSTVMKRGRRNVPELAVGDYVIVLARPAAGGLQATLVRVVRDPRRTPAPTPTANAPLP